MSTGPEFALNDQFFSVSTFLCISFFHHSVYSVFISSLHLCSESTNKVQNHKFLLISHGRSASSIMALYSLTLVRYQADNISMNLRKQKNFKTLHSNEQKWCHMRKFSTFSISSKTMTLSWIIISRTRICSLYAEFWYTPQCGPFKKLDQNNCFLSCCPSSSPNNMLHFVRRKKRKVLKIMYGKTPNTLILRL